MTSATTSGCEIITTCDASTSVIFAPARFAIDITASAPTALSPVATTAQDGYFFQAGGPVGSPKPDAATGRWVALMIFASLSETSAAKAVLNLAGSMESSTAGARPLAVGYSVWRRDRKSVV